MCQARSQLCLFQSSVFLLKSKPLNVPSPLSCQIQAQDCPQDTVWMLVLWGRWMISSFDLLTFILKVSGLSWLDVLLFLSWEALLVCGLCGLISTVLLYCIRQEPLFLVHYTNISQRQSWNNLTGWAEHWWVNHKVCPNSIWWYHKVQKRHYKVVLAVNIQQIQAWYSFCGLKGEM